MKIKNSNLKDLSAGIIVFLVALPLCLGIALASKAPEFSGIIAGVIGGIVVGVLSGAPLSVSGPAAGLSSIVATSITELNSFPTFLLCVVLAGGFQLIFGYLKWGGIGDYIPNSVIKGMLAAIGLILILKQLPHLIGYDKDYEGDENFLQFDQDNTFSALLHAVNSVTPLAIVAGLIGLAVLIFYETKLMKKQKWTTFLSGPLTVVIVGILITQFFEKPTGHFSLDVDHYVNIPIAGSVADFLNFFTLPNFSAIGNGQVWTIAITIALVASIETILGIEAVDKLDPSLRISPPNRELLAQGVGNIVSGLIGGLPITSVIVRSSANVTAGAVSKLSTVIHGVVLMLTVMFVPNIMNMIPKASLAAVLIFTGYKLIKPSIIKHYYKLGWSQFIPFIVTIVCIVATDLLKGVFVGILVGIYFVIKSNFKETIISVNDGSNYLIQLQKDTFFFAKPILKQKLSEVPNDSSLILDVSKARTLDHDIKEQIQEFKKSAKSKNIKFEIKYAYKREIQGLEQ